VGARDFDGRMFDCRVFIFVSHFVHLVYPAPRNKNGESEPFYRRPRGFIGSFDYTREPCYPTIGENSYFSIS
jgi:hypothetical protein